MAAALLALTAVPASAAATRAEYAGQVNTICASVGDNVNRALKKLGKKKDPKSLFRVLERVNKVLRRMVNGVAQVPAAPGDEALVADWVASLRRVTRLTDRVTDLTRKLFRAFKKPPKPKALIKLGFQLDQASSRLLEAADLSTTLGIELGATECVGG